MLYARLMQLIRQLGAFGLIHGDFNEFNLMLTRDSAHRPTPILIDFPQMVSIDHQQGQFYFERDVECVRVFFEKRFGFVNEDGAIEEATWDTVLEESKREGQRRLDVELRASGHIKLRRSKKSLVDAHESFESESESFESESEDEETDNDTCEKSNQEK